jgi:cobalt-precorrin 5A hydrolase / cobalt-factor III methyltransferase / precorrin-3B C17-methyltransferase
VSVRIEPEAGPGSPRPLAGEGIGLIAATRAGRDLAAHLAAAWPGARVFAGRPGEALAAAWGECRALVLFMATGAAVRLAAPLLAGKRVDPGIVCVDDAARHAVAVLGGHEGGANALAYAVADTLGCTPVVTTATDAAGCPALDSLGADLGFRLDPASDVATVASALLAGETVTLVSELRWPLPPLPHSVVRSPVAHGSCIVVSDRVDHPAVGARPAVVYRPPSLVVGVGCSRGASADEILGLIDETLAEAGLCPESVSGLATVDAKRNEAGLVEAAARRGWPLACFPATRLASVPVPNPSDAALAAVGTPSVAEAAALAAGGTLVVPKRKSAHATAAVARVRPRGRLHVVGAGPGDPGLLPPMARAALARSEHVVGLGRYVDAVRPFLRPGTQVEPSELGSEEARAARAVELAASGASVALVSSGDAGVYGMASPALAVAGADIDVLGVPGVTAATAAAALLGAPLGHDHCAISLSDLLTPWDVIRRRLSAAAAADFVVTLYNPRSRNRHWQLTEACRLLLEHRSPDTPVGVVTDAFRPGQQVTITSLGALDVTTVGMTTTVVVGNSSTVVREGRMVTPRGYAAPRRPRARACRTVHPIEAESYRILREAVDLSALPPLSRAVAERVVHSTADPDIARTLVLDEEALAAGLEALRDGCAVVVDARMVAAGITSRTVLCALDFDVPPADGDGLTRSARAVRAAAGIAGPGAVWVVGCAPTALFEVLASAPAPALVVGLPVGFVGAAESKEALATSGLPALTNRGPKGGSAAAAAAVNALLYFGGEEPR